MSRHRHNHEVAQVDGSAIAQALIDLTEADQVRWRGRAASYKTVCYGLHVCIERSITGDLFNVMALAGNAVQVSCTKAERRALLQAAARQRRRGFGASDELVRLIYECMWPQREQVGKVFDQGRQARAGSEAEDKVRPGRMNRIREIERQVMERRDHVTVDAVEALLAAADQVSGSGAGQGQGMQELAG